MSDDIEDLIADARKGISIYTNDFSGDIGQRFKRVDARLERASEASESSQSDVTDVYDHLQDAKEDLETVVRRCFTGVSPGNFQKYVEAPIEDAVETTEERI